MAKVTKGVERFTGDNDRKYTYANLGPILASQIQIDKSKLTLLEHVLNEAIHGEMSSEEIEKLKQELLEHISDEAIHGTISQEEWDAINEKLENKSDKNHTHNEDKDFFILANQVIETEDRKFLNNNEKIALSGINGNIQTQLNILKLLTEEAMKFKGRYNSYSDMIKNNPKPNIGDTTFIDNDENQENASTIYYYTGTTWLRIKKDKANENNSWIASNIAPTNKNLLWIDVSQKNPSLKWYNGASWTDISGLKEVPANIVIEETDLHFVDDRALGILNKMDEDIDTGLLTYGGIILGSGQNTGVNIDDSNIAIDTTFSSYKINDELLKKQAVLGYIPENLKNKGIANGYVPLDDNSKIDKNYLYKSHFIVPDEDSRQLITDMKEGNICYVEATTEFYIYSSNDWRILSKGDAIVLGRNQFDGERNPLNTDDNKEGYLPGSTWINKYTKKAFICTDSTPDNAQWDLMAGQVTLNIGEVIPFKIDITTVIHDENVYKYRIPAMDLSSDFVEISYNGIELILNEDYSLENGDECTYVVISSPIETTDNVFGEIYKHDLKLAEEQMLKMQYDSNNNGKVDIAELSDVAKKLPKWDSKILYKVNDMIQKNGSIYTCKIEHTSSNNFENDKWDILVSEAIDLSKFTTDDLKESENNKYVTSSEKIDISQLPSVFNKVNALSTQLSINTSNISALTSKTDTLKNRLDNFKFTSLTDTPSKLYADRFLKVNSDGTAITQIIDPRFPIKSITDSTGTRYSNIETPIFKHLEMTKKVNDNYTFELRANATELLDMPHMHEHGKVLVSDVNNQKFVLADKEDLTMSIENFSKIIEQSDWIEMDNAYEYVVEHNMSSEALVVSFVDELKIEDKDVTYEILDKNRIRIVSYSNKQIVCTINCSLGAGNGYWQYLMDWSKIDFVDDSKIRLDRAYSSEKLTNMLKSYAIKTDFYTRVVSDSKYANILYEHEHDNRKILDDIDIDSDGDITFKGVRLLTEMNPLTISLDYIFNERDFSEIYDMNTIYKEHNLQAILASEILVQNISNDEAVFKIRDGSIDLISVTLASNEVQKYHLGISNKIKVLAKGNIKTMLTVSAF